MVAAVTPLPPPLPPPPELLAAASAAVPLDDASASLPFRAAGTGTPTNVLELPAVAPLRIEPCAWVRMGGGGGGVPPFVLPLY